MQLEVGAILTGKVTGLTNFGAFLELPGGKTGMVHISEISTSFVNEVSDYLKEGQEVKVKVLSISDDGKISLSIRRAVEQPKKPHQDGGRPQKGNSRPRAPYTPRPAFSGRPGEIDFQSRRNEGMSFEDMMQKYKQVSEDKMSDLRRGAESKHGGFSKKGSRGGGAGGPGGVNS